MEIKTILFTKENWLNSQLSIARFYGGLRLGGHEYLIIPDSGDLLREDFIKYYKKLGRERFIEIMKANNQASEKELKAIYDTAVEEAKESKNKEVEQPNLFDND